MTNKEKLIREVLEINNEKLAEMLSHNKNKCELCIKNENDNCRVSDCQPGIKQWLESEYKENKKIYKIEELLKN